MPYDLLIKNARLRGMAEGTKNIGIKDGKIASLDAASSDEANESIDAAGCLVSESFVNGHLHLDKVYTLEMAGQEALEAYNQDGMGGAMTAIERAAGFKAAYDESWILPNVRKVCDLALKHGNTHIRAFADVDSKARLEGVKALLKARDEYKGRVTLEVVAFPQDGVVREPGTVELIDEAARLGVDIIGGIPWIEFTRDDELEHIESMFEIARKYDLGMSMLLDDVGDPEQRCLEMLCLASIEYGWQGRVTAQHCRAMSLYNENYFRKLTALMDRAGIGLIADPQTGPLYARVEDLLRAGIPVGLGQDDVADAYYPFGECNMLQIAFLGAHLMWMLSFTDMELLYDMVTWRAADVLGLKGHRVEVGGTADLVVLEDEDVYHAIWHHRPPRYVIKDGVVVHTN